MGLLSKIWNWFWRSSQETQSPQEQNAQGLGTQQDVQGSQGLGIQQDVQGSQGLGTQQNVQDTQGLGTQQNVQATQGLGTQQDVQGSQGFGTQQNVQDTQGLGTQQSVQATQGLGTQQNVQQENGNMERILSRTSPQTASGVGNRFWILRGKSDEEESYEGEVQDGEEEDGEEEQKEQEVVKKQDEEKGLEQEEQQGVGETAMAAATTPAVLEQEAVPEMQKSARKLTERAKTHMTEGEWVPRKYVRGEWVDAKISGCHNANRFYEMIAGHHLQTKVLISKDTLIEYEIYANKGKVYLGKKTVYLRTDDEMVILAQQAMEAGKATDDGAIEGVADGITFRGYLNNDGDVDAVYPIIPRRYPEKRRGFNARSKTIGISGK